MESIYLVKNSTGQYCSNNPGKYHKVRWTSNINLAMQCTSISYAKRIRTIIEKQSSVKQFLDIVEAEIVEKGKVK